MAASCDTIRRCLTWPGGVATDYLEGRRSKIVDPLQYFAACVFVQYVLAWAARKLTELTGQESLLNWQEHFSGFIAGRFLFIFWFGTLWYLMFPRGARKLSEIYVFATYAFPTVGLLWSVLPFIDLMVPVELGVTRGIVLWTKFAVELVLLHIRGAHVRACSALAHGLALHPGAGHRECPAALHPVQQDLRPVCVSARDRPRLRDRASAGSCA